MSKPGPRLPLDFLRWASVAAEPLDHMPPPAVRQALRQAVGVPRHVASTVLGVGDQTFYRAEKGLLASPSLIVGNKAIAYRRLLGVFAAELSRSDPQKLADIVDSDREPADASQDD